MSTNEKKSNELSRREMITSVLAGAVAIPLISRGLASGVAQAGACPPSATTAGAQAKALMYVEDAAAAQKEKAFADAMKTKVGKKPGEQICTNCTFYKENADCKKEGRGNCTMFAGKSVADKGWCNSWVLKKA